MRQTQHYSFALAALMGPLWQWASLSGNFLLEGKQLAAISPEVSHERKLDDETGPWCDENVWREAKRVSHEEEEEPANPDATLPALKSPANAFRSEKGESAALFQLTLPDVALAAFEAAIYDFMGRPVRRALNGEQASANQTLVWDGRDDAGQLVPSGKYWYRVKTAKRIYSKMLIVAR